MKKIREIAGTLALLVIFTGCKHDHLYYALEQTATVKIHLDWSEAKITPNGVSAVAYDALTGELYKEFPASTNTQELRLPLGAGSYTIVIYNNTPAEYAAVSFAGIESHDSYWAHARAKEGSRAPQQIDFTSKMVMNPEVVASATIQEVTITTAELEVYYDRPDHLLQEEVIKEYTVKPQRRVDTFVVIATVKNLSSLYAPPSTLVGNLSEGFYLAQEVKSDERVAHESMLSYRDFEGGSTDGVLSNEFTSFGLLTDPTQGCTLDVVFQLNDGTTLPYLQTIPREEIEFRVDPTDGIGRYYLYFEVTLPEGIGGGDGGFDVESEEWNDVVIGVPM